MRRASTLLLALLLLALIPAEGLFGQDKEITVTKGKKIPITRFFDDLYSIYEDTGSVFTLTTTIMRDRVQGLAFNQLWGNLVKDPTDLAIPYKPFLSADPFAVFSADFRTNPIRPLNLRFIFTFLPVTGRNLSDNYFSPNAPYSYQKIQVGATINFVEAIQLMGDFSYFSGFVMSRFSNNQGGAVDQTRATGDEQGAIDGSYNRRIHNFSLELKNLKSLFFEPRFRVDWVNEQYTYFRSADQKSDIWGKSFWNGTHTFGINSDWNDGVNGEYQKNFLTFSTGFTLNAFQNVIITTYYKLTPTLLRSQVYPQLFTSHFWGLWLDFRIDKHIHFITSLSITRYVYQQSSPYNSFFYDYTFETKDPAGALNEAEKLLNFSLNERLVDRDTITIKVEYR